MTCRLQRCDDAGIGGEVAARQREALGSDAAECAERDREVGHAGRLRRLHHGLVDGDVGAVAAGPNVIPSRAALPAAYAIEEAPIVEKVVTPVEQWSLSVNW